MNHELNDPMQQLMQTLTNTIENYGRLLTNKTNKACLFKTFAEIVGSDFNKWPISDQIEFVQQINILFEEKNNTIKEIISNSSTSPKDSKDPLHLNQLTTNSEKDVCNWEEDVGNVSLAEQSNNWHEGDVEVERVVKKVKLEHCPWEEEFENETPTKRANNCAAIPEPDKRYDQINHWPIVDSLDTARKCRFEHCKSRTRVRCNKCNVYLCISKYNSCFEKFHTR